MRSACLAILVVALCAGCGGMSKSDGGADAMGADAAGSDAAPVCRALGSSVDPISRDRDDFQTSCGETSARDDAYTYVVPSAGFYQFTAESASGSAGPASIAILDGDCEGSELACNCQGYSTSSATESTVVVYAEADQVLTVVAEECGGSAPASASLTVTPRTCPWATAPSTGTSTPTLERGEVIPLPCSTCFDGTSACMQAIIEWTAPDSATYGFAATEGFADDVVAIAVLDGDCRGTMLDCGTNAARASSTIAVTAGQTITIVMEARYFETAPAGYAPPTLRVTKALAMP